MKYFQLDPQKLEGIRRQQTSTKNEILCTYCSTGGITAILSTSEWRHL